MIIDPLAALIITGNDLAQFCQSLDSQIIFLVGIFLQLVNDNLGNGEGRLAKAKAENFAPLVLQLFRFLVDGQSGRGFEPPDIEIEVDVVGVEIFVRRHQIAPLMSKFSQVPRAL